MPTSMIFAGLVVVWLVILVPAVARHRQEVARPSVAALSGRVLERPRRRRNLEVDVMDELDQFRTVATRPDPDQAGERQRVPAARSGDDHGPAPHDDIDVDDVGGVDDGGVEHEPDRRWERPPPRYRPGRGGYDPEAAALTARARYAFRQRVVLALLIGALGTGIAAAVAVPGLWWAHAAVDAVLVGYLGYLRRQVRMEESIRERRGARMAGTRRPSGAADPEREESDSRGRAASKADDGEAGLDEDADRPEPLRTAPADDAATPDDATAEDVEPALPRRQPAPPPALPAGTVLVEADDEDPDLPDLDSPTGPEYRRAAGE